MKIWMLNARLEDFVATKEYCGFASEKARGPVSEGDKIVYLCNGVIFGIFEAGKLVEREFAPWKVSLPFQVKLKKIMVPEKGLIAGPLHYKTRLQPHANDSPSLWRLSEWEFEKIVQAIAEGKKELVF